MYFTIIKLLNIVIIKKKKSTEMENVVGFEFLSS